MPELKTGTFKTNHKHQNKNTNMEPLFNTNDLLTYLPAIAVIITTIAIIAGIRKFKSVKH